MRRALVGGTAVAVVAVAATAGWFFLARAPGPPGGVLETSGRIEGDQAAVAARVGGTIVRLAVREGDRPQAGALIAELASAQVRAQLEQAEHGLHTAREQQAEAQARLASARRQAEGAALAVTLAERESAARIGEARAALGAAQARVRQAEADLVKAAKDHARARELFAKELIAAQQLDQARAAEDVARAAAEAARQQVVRSDELLELARASRVAAALRHTEAQLAAERVEEARAAVATARARVQTAEAGVALARANLADTRVVAPFAGTVLRTLVEPGEAVAAGTPLVTLVDLGRLYAKVYVAEGRIGQVRLGAPARVYADAFPARAFEATVSAVAQQAEFTPRDVHMRDERTALVFALKLAVRNPGGVLKPGMPVDARIRLVDGAPWEDGRPAP